MKSRHVLISIFTVFLFLFASGMHLSAYKFDFTTVGDIVKGVKKRFGEIDCYQANFVINSDKMGKKKTQTGTIRYKSSDRLLVEFSQPSGQKIVANDKTMWIYIPSMNVVAEQDLKSDTGFFSTGTKSGLKRLFSKYHYRFASKEQPEVQDDGSKCYTLILKQKETRSGFRTLKLWVSPEYFIVRAAGETSTGKRVDISFTNIRTDVKHPNGIFRMEMPARANVIKNPMISEE